jgi:hypothetical protein
VKGLEFLDWINDELTVLAEAFGEPLTEQRQEIYCGSLADVGQDQLQIAFRRARCELKWFPKIAEIRELAGVLSGELDDGRPGPEQAWARMPKGQHVEDDSIVWCEEERAAYSVCRSLLIEGDQIGARMAFKESYQNQLAEARSQRRPAQWTLSAGYDMSHRLSTLAAAVRENRMSVENALHFVPGERRNDFALMLPAADAKGLLTGEVEHFPDLPGLAGILAKMQMEGVLPEELETPPSPVRKTPADRSPEEARELREKLYAQIDFLKRSRNGSKVEP